MNQLWSLGRSDSLFDNVPNIHIQTNSGTALGVADTATFIGSATVPGPWFHSSPQPLGQETLEDSQMRTPTLLCLSACRLQHATEQLLEIKLCPSKGATMAVRELSHSKEA